MSSAVNVICELARKNAKNYLPLAPTLYKLLTTSNNNWMLIKIIKLVRDLSSQSSISQNRVNFLCLVRRFVPP